MHGKSYLESLEKKRNHDKSLEEWESEGRYHCPEDYTEPLEPRQDSIRLLLVVNPEVMATTPEEIKDGQPPDIKPLTEKLIKIYSEVPSKSALPGSEMRIEQMRARVAAGFSPFHEEDIRVSKKKTKRIAKHHPNGADYHVYASEESNGGARNGSTENPATGVGQNHGRPAVSGAREHSATDGG